MPTMTSSRTSSELPYAQTDHHVKPHWLNRHHTPVSPMMHVNGGEREGLHARVSLRRPRTAPSVDTRAVTATAAMPTPLPPPLSHSPAAEQLSINEPKAPSHIQRPRSGVLRNVNAWLVASKPSTPLMGGLPYWRDGAPESLAEQAAGVQYTIPVVREPEGGQSSTSGSQPLKAFCRRAKRIQVRMPSLQRTRSQRAKARKQTDGRSSATPTLGIPYEDMQQCSSPTFVTVLGSTRRPATANAAPETAGQNERFGAGYSAFIDLPMGRSASVRPREPATVTGRQLYAGHTARSGAGLRPVPVMGDIYREDSIGSISDAPTYSSGPPPPSYRSRPASILTTSSFGCIDGLNPEYRQLSQQRAQEKRSMKGKLKRFAQKCALTK